MKEASIENLYSGMLEQLGYINGSIRESVQNLNESLSCIADTINELRERIRRHPFEDEMGEINFFKYTKPRFCAWQTYVVELHKILSSVPVGTDQMVRDYYMEEIGVVNRFFRLHAFHHQYYVTDEHSKDKQFFLRRNRSLFPPGRELLSDCHQSFCLSIEALMIVGSPQAPKNSELSQQWLCTATERTSKTAADLKVDIFHLYIKTG